MLPPSLTSRTVRSGGCPCHEYTWRGRAIPVFDTLANGLLVIELLEDPGMTALEKYSTLMMMLFPDPVVREELADMGAVSALGDILWDAFGIDITGKHDDEVSGAKAFDWKQDADRIRSSILQAYGIDWTEFADTHGFREGVGLLTELCEGSTETPFSTAVRYRVGKPPKRTKHNGDEVNAWMRMKDHYALDDGRTCWDRTAESFEDLRRQAGDG